MSFRYETVEQYDVAYFDNRIFNLDFETSGTSEFLTFFISSCLTLFFENEKKWNEFDLEPIFELEVNKTETITVHAVCI